MSITFVKGLKYSIFPRHCEICGEVVPFTDRICSSCTTNVRIPNDACITCGLPKVDCTCSKAHHKPDYKGVVAPFRYSNNVPKAIHRLKFYGRSELAKPMGKQIANAVKAKFDGVSFDYVTAVPLYYRRNWHRGYNQSELLAKSVANELGVDYKRLVKKVLNNPPQRTLPARYRRGNVFGVYDLRSDADIVGKTILVIDDVKTTGATINACSYVLKIYGASSVYAATFAIR